MKKIKIFLSVIIVIMVFGASGQVIKTITLPPPQTDGGMPLMKALKERQTSRTFSDKKLGDQVISNLLWAAWGINRPAEKKRTAPSSMNKQEIDIYVVMADGFYIYDAEKQSLDQLSKVDVREKAGKQDFVKTAPMTLVYVADYSKMGKGTDQEKAVTSNTDAAFISENVYLFCASEGLSTGVRAFIDMEELHKALNLKPDQHITLAQCAGYPK